MKSANDLTEGHIFKKLLYLALPIMGTSFVQMAYNLTDQMWLGHVSSKAVGAAGVAGFFLWFGMSLVHCAKVGAEVGVSQSFGRKNYDDCRSFMKHSILLGGITVVVYVVLALTFARELIGFFDMDDLETTESAVSYLRIVLSFIILSGLNPVFSGIYNGIGNTKRSFYISASGLLLNLILDPLLINGWLGFPKMGLHGAAIATGISMLLVSVLYVIALSSNDSPMRGIKLLGTINWHHVRRVLKVGVPASFQNGVLCIFAMCLMKITSRFGDLAVSVQSVGVQIESLSWMTALGFSSALASFIGQNYGAGRWDRIRQGYKITFMTSLVIGGFSTILFTVFGEWLFGLFIPEAEAVVLGADYLFILGISQIFMCIDIVSAGAFQGVGKTIPASIMNAVFFGARIPMSLLLNSCLALGVYSVWWSMSLTSIFKGVIITVWFILFLRKHLQMANHYSSV